MDLSCKIVGAFIPGFNQQKSLISMSTNTNWKQDIRYLGGSAEKEAEIILKFGKDIREAVQASAEKRNAPPIRPQHAKQLAGIRRAEFRVSPDIPADLQYGFLQPGRVFPACVRFSNAAGEIRLSDAKSDLRGAAVRVLPDTGPAHDWLMTNAEQHHAKDAIGAMATTLAFARGSWVTSLLEALFGKAAPSPAAVGRISGIAELLAGIRRLVFQMGPAETLQILRPLTRQTKRPMPSLAMETFWSRAPVAIGPVAAKYLLRPQLPKAAGPTPDSLHYELAQRLLQGPVIYDLCLQRYRDPESTPIENARPAWASPHEKIAELVLLQQDLNDDTGQADSRFVQMQAYNPWQVNTPDFVPIGNMNRARKSVYAASAAERQEQNQTPA